MTGTLTGESIHQQRGNSRDSLCRVRALCPRFFAAQKLGSGPLLRALPRDPHSNTTRRASLDLKLGITTVTEAGARLLLACRIAGIDALTLRCWQAHEGLVKGDGRPQAVRPTPCHALRLEERAKLLSVTNESRFCVAPPARIVLSRLTKACIWPASPA